MSLHSCLAETVDSINKAEIKRRVAISLVSTFYGFIFVYMIKKQTVSTKVKLILALSYCISEAAKSGLRRPSNCINVYNCLKLSY